MSTDFVWRDVPDRERRTKTALAATLTVISGYFGATVVPYIDNGDFVYVLWALYALYMCLCIAYTYQRWTTRRVQVLAPDVERAQRAQQQEELLRQQQFESKWYFRYPMAALMAWGGIYLALENDKLWWLGAILCLVALFQAWEMLLMGLALGGIYLVFKGVAALPVSVAIVVGAVIIAGALARRRS